MRDVKAGFECGPFAARLHDIKVATSSKSYAFVESPARYRSAPDFPRSRRIARAISAKLDDFVRCAESIGITDAARSILAWIDKHQVLAPSCL